jgi:hypothetical protein
VTIPKFLDRASDFAQLATGIAAAWAANQYRKELNRKVKILEDHLREEKRRNGGMRTIVHIVASTGLTEQEILAASFRSTASNVMCKWMTKRSKPRRFSFPIGTKMQQRGEYDYGYAVIFQHALTAPNR